MLGILILQFVLDCMIGGVEAFSLKVHLFFSELLQFKNSLT